MDDWYQIIKSVAVSVENVTTVGRRLFEMTIDKGGYPERDAYRKRVRNRKKTGEFRPEWDLLGRVAFDELGSQYLTEMDAVPQHLQDTMTNSIRSGRIKPGSANTVQVSDENYLYMLEVGTGWPYRNSMIFVFWQRPA